MTSSRLGPIAVTCGEPAGVGPEIIAKAWAELRDAEPFFALGSPAHFAGFGVPVHVITDPAEAQIASATGLPVLAHEFTGPAIPGTPDPAHAQGVIDVIARGVELVQAGHAAALCTAPIHKKALKDGANFAYPGHTEFLAALAGVERVVMMLACDALKVVPTTIHIPLADVPALSQLGSDGPPWGQTPSRRPDAGPLRGSALHKEGSSATGGFQPFGRAPLNSLA